MLGRLAWWTGTHRKFLPVSTNGERCLPDLSIFLNPRRSGNATASCEPDEKRCFGKGILRHRVYGGQNYIERSVVAKVLVLYYSACGHIETMAEAIASGAHATGAIVDVKRVAETAPDEIARIAHFGFDQSAPIAAITDLEQYDAIIIGTGTRFGRVSSQMAAFLDQAGALWARGALNGKIGSAFASTASQHGGQETTLFSIITNLLHFGMIVIGLPYGFQGLTILDGGGAPYGATTIAGTDGSRHPSENELAGARFQGQHVAEIAQKLFG